jgi:hypothetical protein
MTLTQTNPDPRKAPPIQVTDLSLSVDVLLDANPDLSRDQAVELAPLLDSERVRPQIEAARTRRQAQADEAAAKTYDASPAGRRERAAAVLAAQQERIQLVEQGRALLELELPQRGFPADALDGMSDQEVLQAAGLTESPETAEEDDTLEANLDAIRSDSTRRLSSRWHQLTNEERESLAREAGVDVEALDEQKRHEFTTRGW